MFTTDAAEVIDRFRASVMNTIPASSELTIFFSRIPDIQIYFFLVTGKAPGFSRS